MDLRRYLRAVRRGWWLVLVVALLGGAVGYYEAASSPKVYAASVTFYVVTPGINNTTEYGSDQLAQDRANSYAQLLSTPGFARLVLAETGLSGSSSDLASAISGSARIDTVLVDARIVSQSLPRLRTIQRGVASQFPIYVKQFETGDTAAVRALPSPPVSSAPVSPRTSVDVAVGLSAGIVLGLLLAALREIVDTSIRSGTELEELAGTPLIGSIAYDATAKRTAVAGSGSSRRAEDFRQLRTNLEFVHGAQKVQVVLVTSSLAGEGKSSTALNVAITAAERGGRVLLVDADLRRPQIADYLGFDGSVGLTTVLTGRVALDIAVRSWGEHELAVLPSGACPPNPTELLDSEGMRTLMATVRSRYDLIVVDTPPVLTVTDAAVCSRLVDATVLVYRYGRTRRANLVGSLHALRAVDARVAGVVLNMRPRRGLDGEQYGNYDSYLNEERPGTRLRRLSHALRHPIRRRPRPHVESVADGLPGYVPMRPVAPAPVRAGFEPPASAEAYRDAAWGTSPPAPGYAARRARRPMGSGRVRVEHLPAQAAAAASITNGVGPHLSNPFVDDPGADDVGLDTLLGVGPARHRA